MDTNKPKVTVVENVPDSELIDNKLTKKSKLRLVDNKVKPIVKDGPFRKYVSSNIYYLSHVGKLTTVDYIVSCGFVIGFFYYMMKQITVETSETEGNFLKVAQFALEKKFYLASVPSLGIQIISKLKPFLDAKGLKMFCLSCSSMTLGLLYLTIRRNNVILPIALMLTGVLAKIPEFQEESIKIGVNSLFYVTFLGTMYCWRSYRINHLQSSKMIWLTLLGVLLGVSMSIRKLGFITWIWIIFCSLIDTWSTIDDISVSMFTIVKKVFYKFLFILVLPLRLFVLFNDLQLTSTEVDTPEFSRYMPTNFQHWLRDNVVNTTETHEVFYGDTVKIRQIESLTGYLISNNVTYYEKDTLVTMSFEEDSDLTHWIIEPKNSVDFGEPVYNFNEVRFRHKISGQLLRASNTAPPISEQEYDKSVLCTGDWDFKGSRDEEWTIEVNGKSRNQLTLNTTKDTFQLYNRGRACTLLGHDLRVRLANFPQQQELICLDKPNRKLTNFQFVLVESTERMSMVPLRTPNKYYLIWQWVRDQFKFDYYILNFDYNSSLQHYNMMEDVEMWPLYMHYENDKLGNTIWITCDIAVILVTLYIFKLIVTFNPWDPKTINRTEESKVRLHVRLLRDNGVEYLLGWFMHWYIFTQSPKRDSLKIVEFLPSLIIAVLVWSQLYNSMYHWHSSTLVILPVVFLVVQYGQYMNMTII